MIVTHGWPGSIVEQLKIIEPLANKLPKGGHFAAREQPGNFVSEMRASFKSLR